MTRAKRRIRVGLMNCPHCKTGQVFRQWDFPDEVCCLQCGWHGTPKEVQVAKRRKAEISR